MTEITTEQLLLWSIEREKHRKLITALKAENEILRGRLRLADAPRFDSTPALLRPQAG